MFYNNRRLALRIKGVYAVNLAASVARERERGFSALSYRIKGDGSFSCGEKDLSLTTGSVVYIPRGVDYTRVSNINESLITIHFETFGEEEKEIEVIEDCERLYPFFATLHELWLVGEYNRCIRTVYKIFDELSIGEESTPTPQIGSIAAGIDYLKSNYRSSDVSIAEAAARCHVSETYFRRIYSAHFGISPISALLDMRFNYAKGLLRSGYYRVKQVAALSGFSDAKYFRTAFKKRFGVTPSEYAAAHANK